MNELQENMLRRAVIGDLVSQAAERFRDRIVLHSDEEDVSFRELNRRACRAANAFAAHGVSSGDRIAFLTHNSVDYICLRLGLAKIGAIPVPMNFMLKGEEISFVLNDSGAKILFAEDKLIQEVDAVRADMPDVDKYVSLHFSEDRSVPEGWLSSDIFLAEDISEAEPEVLIRSDDVASLMYTSGTESFPKGVMTTHLNYYISMLHMSSDCGYRRGDVSILDLPLFHVAGKCALLCAITYGMKCIVAYEPNPMKILQKTQDEGVTIWIYPPTLYNALPSMPGFEEFDLSSLRQCTTFGAAMPQAVFDKWNAIKPDIQWLNYWGQTESSPVGATAVPADFPHKSKSIGLPDTAISIKIVDDDGNEVDDGTPGEIIMRGPSVMKGYWNRPDLTEKTLAGGWLHSGDIGYRDEDGYIFFADRKKDMIKSGGENVSSQEVEGALLKHPAVALAAVFGMPHEHWIEAVTGAVVLREGSTATPEELIAFCKENLAGYKVPKDMRILEKMPLTASGKVLKRLVKEQLLA